ncbi:radical SAM protein [Dehalococcoidia bacterium]|nr:radical SAM protein [Dehalococcoidia bacterium]
MTRRKKVILINPPNSSQVLHLSRPNGYDVKFPPDWGYQPNLAILTLASALLEVPLVEPVYLDGMACPLKDIFRYISDNRDATLAVCVSMLTGSYQAGLSILEHAKSENQNIVTVVGNDHFTALYELCLRNRKGIIDYGFVGNEVITSFRSLVADLAMGSLKDLHQYAGITAMTKNGVVAIPQHKERIFTDIHYPLIDAVYPHNKVYTENFQRSIAERVRIALGKKVAQGIPVEIARGCIKFRNDNACTFCSIQFGGMWRNSVADAAGAWSVLWTAHKAGYDYLNITADELPLTFTQLLRQMELAKPEWWTAGSEAQRPLLSCYARPEGLQKDDNVRRLANLGYRWVMVGVDAVLPISLSAINKPLFKSGIPSAERIFTANRAVLTNAGRHGIRLKLGLVLGHLGMTKALLREGVEAFCTLIDSERDSVAAVDVSILSPEPGSRDYAYLVHPDAAQRAAESLVLEIADHSFLRCIGDKWRDADIVDIGMAVDDYVKAMMPELSVNDLRKARTQILAFCKARGIMTREDLGTDYCSEQPRSY